MGELSAAGGTARLCNQVPLQRTSYGPMPRAMVRICQRGIVSPAAKVSTLMMKMWGPGGVRMHRKDGSGCAEPHVVIPSLMNGSGVRQRIPCISAVHGVGKNQDEHQTTELRPEVRRPDGAPQAEIPRPDRGAGMRRWRGTREKGGYDFASADWDEVSMMCWRATARATMTGWRHASRRGVMGAWVRGGSCLAHAPTPHSKGSRNNGAARPTPPTKRPAKPAPKPKRTGEMPLFEVFIRGQQWPEPRVMSDRPCARR